MDSNLLHLILSELNTMFSGGILRQIKEESKGNFLFSIYTGTEKTILIRLGENDIPVICLQYEKNPPAAVPSSFCMLLRKYILNRRIDEITQYETQKIAVIKFSDSLSSELIIDFTKKRGNMILLCDKKIKGSYFQLAENSRTDDNQLIFPPSKFENLNLPSPEELCPCLINKNGKKEYFLKEVENAKKYSSFNEMFFNFVFDKKEETDLETKKKSIISAIKADLKKMAKRKEAIKGDLEKLLKNTANCDIGNTILANIGLIPEKSEIIELPNISNPDEILKIELDPRKNPSENAQDYFEKFKKSKRGIPILEERLQQTEEHEEYLNSYLDIISETDNLQELEQIEDTLKHGKPISKNSFVQISSPRKYKFMNFTIISGKNPEQNDEVSLKIASKNDMWFHARGMGGSHVIIKSDKNEKPPKEVIVRAAEIAAYHSKGKNSSKVQVIQTFARHVQKKKGMAPGAVRVAKENSITVNPTNYDFLEWLKKQTV